MTRESSAKYYAKNKTRISLKAKTSRRENVAQSILTDARRADRKSGRSNDLDVAFVREIITNPCSYCGDVTQRMTLDRLDNERGHLKENVVPSCERCNYVRRDMPIEAWKLVATAMRRAREMGLFGAWTCSIHRRHQLSPVPPLPARRERAPHGTLSRYGVCGPPKCDECRLAMRDWKRGQRKNNAR